MMLDGELPAAQIEMVRRHVASCRICDALARNDAGMTEARKQPFAFNSSFLAPSLRLRGAAALLGSLIILMSFPDFVRGSALGVTFHDLRHLAIWQTAVGITILAGAVTFRLSRLLVILVGSFLVMTLAAVVYDVITGHQGPWTDPAHIAEVLAVIVFLTMLSPRLRALGVLAPRGRKND